MNEQIEMNFDIGKAYEKPKYFGETFDKELDQERLDTLFEKVKKFMSDGNWHTAPEIRRGIGASPDTDVNRRVRDLRQQNRGGYIIESARVEHGVWKYRMSINPDGEPK